MLKWALNGPRQSYLPSVENQNFVNFELRTQDSNATLTTDQLTIQRKSLEYYLPRTKSQWEDGNTKKITSTPLHSSTLFFNDTHLPKLHSPKDLSSIGAENTPKRLSTKSTSVPKSVAPIARTSSYAATLPTFEVEYSPCGLIPGPILALRGIGIADSYFEKPRYLAHKLEELYARSENETLSAATATATTKSAPVKPLAAAGLTPAEESSFLSSAEMSDMTLERMIDAILESTRKDRKHVKSAKPSSCSPVMSPTYTAADDPASDLTEFCDESDDEKFTYLPQPKDHLRQMLHRNQRELRFPLNPLQPLGTVQLRRQRAVRRKRKLKKLTSSVRQSAQKLLGSVVAGAQSYQKLAEVRQPAQLGPGDGAWGNRKSADSKKQHTSPDSGHNSCSDLSDSKHEGSLELLDIKRRLCFSTNNLNVI